VEGDVKSEYNFCEQVDVPIAERAYNLGGGLYGMLIDQTTWDICLWVG